MKTMDWHNLKLNLPAGRLGWQQEAALLAIARSDNGTSLRLALALRGRARQFEGRYLAALTNVIRSNPELFELGRFGPRGGWGARLTEKGCVYFKEGE